MTDCRTRYPLLLVHGLNCRDDWIFSYWGRMADILREHGAAVFLSGQDAWGSVPGNARALLSRGEAILAETGSEKLNLIAHSKGGLEARYLVSTLGFAPKAASLTTICTPHHGSKAAAEWLAEETGDAAPLAKGRAGPAPSPGVACPPDSRRGASSPPELAAALTSVFLAAEQTDASPPAAPPAKAPGFRSPKGRSRGSRARLSSKSSSPAAGSRLVSMRRWLSNVICQAAWI